MFAMCQQNNSNLGFLPHVYHVVHHRLHTNDAKAVKGQQYEATASANITVCRSQFNPNHFNASIEMTLGVFPPASQGGRTVGLQLEHGRICPSKMIRQ